MYTFNLNYILSNWAGPTQLHFTAWIFFFISLGYTYLLDGNPALN